MSKGIDELRRRGAKTLHGEDIAELVLRQMDAHSKPETVGGAALANPGVSEPITAKIKAYNPGKEIKLYDGKKEHRFGVVGELIPLNLSNERNISK